MPLTAFGDLKIVSSQDIGSLGPREGYPVTYHWYMLWNVLVFLPYVCLLGLFASKPNRNRPALAVLFPFAALAAPLLLLDWGLVRAGRDEPALVAEVLLAILNGLAALWLISHSFIGQHRWKTLRNALAVFLGFAVLTAFSQSLRIPPAIVCAGACVTILLGLALAGKRCRRRFTGMRFTLWACLGILLTCAGITLPLACLAALIDSDISAVAEGIVLSILVASPLCILLLPFLVLTFRSAIYRQRFLAVFGLTEGTPVPETGPQPEPLKGGNHDESQ